MNKNPTKVKLDYIDSLRGIAILMVILVHTSQSVSDLPKCILVITKYGQMGVLLFFVISALTLCISLDKASTLKWNLLSFYIKRFFRIAPLYYVGIAFYFFYSAVLNFIKTKHFIFSTQYTLQNIFSNVFFIHGFVPEANNNIVPGGWSIGTEMAFYLVFPIIFFLFRNKNHFLRLLYLIIISGLCYISINLIGLYRFSTSNNSFLYYNLINMLPVFILGVFFYNYKKYHQIEYMITNKITNLILLLLFTLISLISFTLYFNISFTPFLCGIAFILMVDIFKRYKILNNNLLMRIGQLSYSMYLFHFIFAWQISDEVNTILINKLQLNPIFILLICYFITVAGTFVLARISEKMVEKPGIKIGNNIIINRYRGSFKKVIPG
jgi:peptidoglycan/LPS O-acetylase OafA/YrhL